MTYLHQIQFTFLKRLLFIAGVLALIVTGLGRPLEVVAQSEGGSTPGQAAPLAKEVNQGALKPGEQDWYVFTPQDTGQLVEIEKSLVLVLTPDNGATVDFVSLKIFEGDQIQFFARGDTGKMTTFGAGRPITRDNNPETGEILWTGLVTSRNIYYIQVLNESDFPIDYWLFNEDLNVYAVGGEPEVPDAPEVAEVAEVEEEVAAEPEAETNALPEEAPLAPQTLGTDPGNPAPLLPGLNRGKIAPYSTYWYEFKFEDFSGKKRFQPLDFTMFATPDDGHRRHRINFELFPYSEYEFWRRGDMDQMTHFGAGMQVSRDGDYNTAERTWRGVVVMNDRYLMAVRNNTDVEIDYWLYDDDIYNPILGPLPEPAPPMVFAPGASPQTAESLQIGLNKGSLNPGEEAWYAFSVTDFSKVKGLREMALTMITTPDDGNRIRNMTFDVFTAGGVKGWSPGDNTQINNLGAGSVVYRDDNPLTGERFWQGWVIDNDLYLVQVRNGTDVKMDYHLYTGDVYRPELGEPTQPVKITFEAGKAPTAPVPLEVGINSGRLGPKQEQWFVFSRGDVDSTGRVETIFTMIFTPNDGHRVRNINFELFEGNQLRDWSPDNRFTINNFGRGSVVERDEDPRTGEMVWKGHVFAGDLYYMRVFNESDTTIDFWVYPEDVISTNLEN